MLSERFDEWHAEWQQEGFQKGEATLLVRLLQKRFGALSQDVRQRLEHAEIAQLESWGERLLDADSLEALLDGTPHNPAG